MVSTLLRLERVKRALKVREVATAIGYHEHYLSDVELANRCAGESFQNALAEYYGQDRASLFNERGFALETA